jgi:ABC-type Fe3+ transport system permease subunit
MSLVEATILAAGRSAGIAIAAVLTALWLSRHLRALSSTTRRSVVALGALSYFAPTMLAGYGWLPTVVLWTANSGARELFYSAFVFFRLAPVAALALWLAHSGPCAEAVHVSRLARVQSWRWKIREAGRAPWLAAGVVFLLAFQEFDLATSWGIRSWTVAVFDAQIGGLALRDSLRLAIAPLLVECAVIVPLLAGAKTELFARTNASESLNRSGAWPISAIYVIAPLTLFAIIPALIVFRLGFPGMSAWLETWSMFREVMHGCISGGVAALLAWLLSSVASARWAMLLVLPGLLGPLLLSLIVLSGIDALPGLSSTVLPWISALTLQLLPVAMLLRALLSRGIDAAGLHAARTARAGKVIWTMQHFPSAGAILLLFGLGYSDFTMSALLAPPQFTTVFVRVFNLMHYGQSAVLSAAVLIAVLVPLTALGLTRVLLGLYVRHCVR